MSVIESKGFVAQFTQDNLEVYTHGVIGKRTNDVEEAIQEGQKCVKEFRTNKSIRCPICGSSVKAVYLVSIDMWQVDCENEKCYTSFPIGETHDEAIENVNLLKNGLVKE